MSRSRAGCASSSPPTQRRPIRVVIWRRPAPRWPTPWPRPLRVSVPRQFLRRWQRRRILEPVLHPEQLTEHQPDAEQHHTGLRPDAYEVIGCVNFDPTEQAGAVAVRSWVRADVAELDATLRTTVRDWLSSSWPFDSVTYAA